MPKKSRDFPDQLTINVTTDLRQKLVALGYLWGHGGEYGGPTRQLLTDAVSRALDDLPEKKLKEYNEILANVKLAEEAGKL